MRKRKCVRKVPVLNPVPQRFRFPPPPLRFEDILNEIQGGLEKEIGGRRAYGGLFCVKVCDGVIIEEWGGEARMGALVRQAMPDLVRFEVLPNPNDFGFLVQGKVAGNRGKSKKAVAP